MDTDTQPALSKSNSAMETRTTEACVAAQPADPTLITIRTSTSSSSLQDLNNLDKPYSLTRRRRSYSDCLGTRQHTRSSSPVLLSPPLSTRSQRARRLNRARQAARSSSSPWLIRADHPFKIIWDLLTILLSVFYIYVTHTSIRDRSIRTSNFGLVCDAWFLVDILLNFMTEYRTEQGFVLRRGQAVWARYLTTWFVVDALSLVPWESLYVKPIIEMQNRRHFFKKYFFRTKAVIRVTRVLRGRHFRLFGKVARHTRHAGVGANRLLRLLIKYVPKYLLFYRNMKGVLAVRMLRQVHWMRKLFRNFCGKRIYKKDDATDSLTMEDFDDYDDYYLDDQIDDDTDSVVHIQMDDDLDLY